MTPYDHIFKGLCDFMHEGPLIVGQHIAKFNSHRPCNSRDIMYLICHVTLQDHVIKGSCDFMEGSSSLYVTTLPCLVAVIIVVVEV